MHECILISFYLHMRTMNTHTSHNPAQMKNRSSMEYNFAACMSLYHGLDLLTAHGLRTFLSFLKGLTGDSGGSGELGEESTIERDMGSRSEAGGKNKLPQSAFSLKLKNEVLSSSTFQQLLSFLEPCFDPIKSLFTSFHQAFSNLSPSSLIAPFIVNFLDT